MMPEEQHLRLFCFPHACAGKYKYAHMHMYTQIYKHTSQT